MKLLFTALALTIAPASVSTPGQGPVLSPATVAVETQLAANIVLAIAREARAGGDIELADELDAFHLHLSQVSRLLAAVANGTGTQRALRAQLDAGRPLLQALLLALEDDPDKQQRIKTASYILGLVLAAVPPPPSK